MRTLRRTSIMFSLLLLAFLTYSNTFQSPFQFDDRTHVLNNSHVRMAELSWQEILDVFQSRSGTRPAPMLTFALNYYFGRYDVVGYHLVNVLIHGINAVLLYFLLRITLGLSPNPLPHPSWVAFLASLLWLAHPVQTQSVTYIVQRINSMAALFYILSLLLYVRGRIDLRERQNSLQCQRTADRLKLLFPWPFLWLTGSVLAGILAMGSKEISVTLPFFIFLYEWYFFQDLSRQWLRRCLPWILAGCIPAATLVALHLGRFKNILTDYGKWDFTFSQRLLTELRVVLYYASLLFYPHPSRLNLDYDFPLSHSLFEPPTTLLSLFVIAGLLGLACWQAKRQRLLSFGILWFFGNLAIESSVIPLDIIFEHRVYLPSMLVSLVVVAGVYRHIRPWWFATGLLCLAVVVLSVWTYQRNEVWRDPESLWADTVRKSPCKARPHNNLGQALARQGDLEEAIAQYREALRIKPDYTAAHNNLGEALARQGNPEEAIAQYRQALRIKPDFAATHYNLGNILAKRGEVEEAISHYREALRIKPASSKAHNNLANLLLNQGENEEAIAHYREALRIDPDYSFAHNNLGSALEGQGKRDEAIACYREALRIQPTFANAHYNLANALLSQHRIREAIQHYREALRVNPEMAEAHNNLGIALEAQGNLNEAITHYRKALEILPTFAQAHYNLGNTLVNQGDLEEGIIHYREALRIDSNYARAHYNLANTLAKQGKLEEAEAHYQEAKRISKKTGTPVETH